MKICFDIRFNCFKSGKDLNSNINFNDKELNNSDL